MADGGLFFYDAPCLIGVSLQKAVIPLKKGIHVFLTICKIGLTLAGTSQPIHAEHTFGGVTIRL